MKAPRRRISRTPQVVINTRINISDAMMAMRLERRWKPVVGYFWVSRSAHDDLFVGIWSDGELLDLLVVG